MNKDFIIGRIDLDTDKVLDSKQIKARDMDKPFIIMDSILASEAVAAAEAAFERKPVVLPTLDFLLAADERAEQAEAPVHDSRFTETFIEVRTAKAACWRFDDVEKATEWINRMREKFGRACPSYNIYRVVKTTKATLIS